MKFIFRQLTRVMKRKSRLVVQVDNIPGRTFTPLVRDLGAVIAASFRPEAEIVVVWDGEPTEYRYTHCLVFRAA
jgi:hypothetical protein